MIFVHGAGGRVNPESDKAAKDDVAGRHDLSLGRQHADAIAVALLTCR